MQKVITFLFIVFLSVSQSFAQCPSAGFTLPNDTLCSVLQFTNTSSPGNYQWDFCPKDLRTIPTGINLGNIAGFDHPSSVKIVNDSGNYHAFITNTSASKIIRLDFGTSLNNLSPDTFSYSGFDFPSGIDVINDNNNWYVLATNYNTGHLLRLDLGMTINNNISALTDLGTFGFIAPRNLRIVKDNNNYFVFISNAVGTNVNKLEFGSSLGNAVSNSSALSDPSFQSVWGIDVTYDCNSNKFIGFTANIGAGNISVIDYGSTLSNTGSVLQTVSVPLYPASLQVINDGGEWNLLYSNLAGNILGQLVLGNNILNPTPLAAFADTVGQLSFPYGFYMIKDSSRWHGIIANNGNNTVSLIKFENNCTANIPSSHDIIPQNIYYTGGGWQHISLSVSDSNFTSFFSDSIYTIAPPVVNFSFSSACTGYPISFYDSSSIAQGNIISWQWDFGDGSALSPLQNPTHLYSNDSTYLVTLTVTSDAGCEGSSSYSISVHDLPAADFSYLNNQCSETLLQFNDLSTTAAGDSVVSWIWDFGDGSPIDNAQNPIHSFDSSGTYSVQLIAFGSSGCTDTISHNITIIPRPVISFTASQTCIGETTLFNNGTTISDGSPLSYTWDFGDGSALSNAFNPTHLYPLISMTYSVQLIANSTNGCADTLLQNVRITSRANPGFIMTSATACLNNPVQFIDTSTIAAGDTIASSMWDFGDGSPMAFGDTVSHIFSTSGIISVTLTVTSLTSCDTSITKTITVLESPTANFTFTNVCENSPMYFFDSSFTPVGSTIDSIIWDFGDTTAQAFGDTVIHGYNSPGTYNVTETVINNFGCSGTITQQVTVYALPVASFTTTIPACTGNAVNFIDQSTVQNDTITGYIWDFGDQSASDTLQNPIHVYSNASTYQVSLIVTTLHGCQATTTLPVTVYPSPLFDFTNSLFCFGDTTHFTYVPLNSVPVSGWLWDFGDFITSILPNPTHHYNTAGSYNTCLTVTALNGCSNTVCKTVIINPKPVAGILSDSVTCIGTSTAFNDNSTISSGIINQWSWNFGDGTPLIMTQNTNHLYSNDSIYIVTHTVISDQGCIDTAHTTIEIAPPPVASFIPDPSFGSPPLLVQFLNTSNGAVTYQWNFGDGGTNFGTSPTYTYTDTGYYSVTLIAINSYLCNDTAYGYISVLVPYLDLGIQEVHTAKLNDLLSLSADLANLGNTAISKFQISAKTETGSPINEQWSSNVSLKPGELYTYNFAARYEIDPLNVPSFYCIEISEINGTNDAVESNNKKCAAINEEFELFDIFPNPSSGTITIGMNVPLEGSVDVTIYNSIGQLMKLDAEIPVAKGYNEFKYSIRNFAKGFYAFTVQFRDNIQVKRIIKK